MHSFKQPTPQLRYSSLPRTFLLPAFPSILPPVNRYSWFNLCRWPCTWPSYKQNPSTGVLLIWLFPFNVMLLGYGGVAVNIGQVCIIEQSSFIFLEQNVFMHISVGGLQNTKQSKVSWIPGWSQISDVDKEDLELGILLFLSSKGLTLKALAVYQTLYQKSYIRSPFCWRLWNKHSDTNQNGREEMSLVDNSQDSSWKASMPYLICILILYSKSTRWGRQGSETSQEGPWQSAGC